jgi:methylthioribose-1-phosphate isomerase
VAALPQGDRAAAAREEAAAIAEEDVAMCEAIGEHGLAIFRELAAARPPGRQGEPLNVLTHCNAGWLATVDWGTALAPIYKAHRAGLPIHVWVDETRPRNQGASLTAFELGREGVPHTVVVDNAGGHLMQHGQVDAVIVGTDRTTRTGDVCNKIGTYLKALAAHDNGVPFYVALPASTIDWSIADGVAEIPIEARSAQEVTRIQGLLAEAGETGQHSDLASVQLTPTGSSGFNPAFDVTPARLVTGLITERGVAPASEAGLQGLYASR